MLLFSLVQNLGDQCCLVLREKATTVLLHDIRTTRKPNEINRTL
jgi:hypothetical protein